MEKSFLWTTGATGDGASTYTQAETFGMFRRMFVTDPTTQGVLKGYEGDLAVTGTTSPISVAKGAAIVYGSPYLSDAATSVAVATPSVGTTGHRVVLQMDWTAQTTRIALLSSADGTATIPDVTQTANTKWEISLASLTITTAGVITVTDTRAYCQPLGVSQTANLADASVTAGKMASGVIPSVPVWLTTRLSSTAWNGDPRSTTAKTKLDLSTVFAGYPDAVVKAVYVMVSIRDSGSADHDCVFILGPDDSANIGIGWRCSGLPADYMHSAGAWVPCDVNGDIYYQVIASGSGTMDVNLDVWGYQQ